LTQNQHLLQKRSKKINEQDTMFTPSLFQKVKQ